MQTKTLHASITDLDSAKGIVRGYLAHWDTPDPWGDFVVKGKTFTKTIAENGPKGSGGIRYLLNDSYKTPLGTFAAIWEDTVGLAYESRLLRRRPGLYSPDSEQIITSADKGYNFNHSYRFEILKQNTTGLGNMLSEVRLFTGSVLYVPIREEKWGTWSTIDGDPVTDMLTALNDMRRVILSREWSEADLAVITAAHEDFGRNLERVRSSPEQANNRMKVCHI